MFISETSSPTKPVAPQDSDRPQQTATAVAVDASHSSEVSSSKSTASRLTEILERVESMVAPLWPLADYVAVNPFLGLADQSFLDARKLLRSVSNAEMLMPADYYRKKLERGEMTPADIAAAIAERDADTFAPRETVDGILQTLQKADQQSTDESAAERRIFSAAEAVDSRDGSNWAETLRAEIGRHCAAHYDQGQASWPSPWKDQSLYSAWHSVAAIDLQMQTLGIANFNRFVGSLPASTEDAILVLLKKLAVPEEHWTEFLLCIAHTVPGWSGWARYQSQQAERTGGSTDDFQGLLAIRLAYDAAIAEQFGCPPEFGAASETIGATSAEATAASDEAVRSILLRATEIAWQRGVLQSLKIADSDGADTAPATSRKEAQLVFCIDVRSERYRRHLEGASSDLETYGFAGFFGVPMAVKAFDEAAASSHVPALLSPAFQVAEHFHGKNEELGDRVRQSRRSKRFFRDSWKRFGSSAASCFGFVETSGLAYGWKLLKKSVIGEQFCSRFDGVRAGDEWRLGPGDPTANDPRLSEQQQIDMAESILRGIGITADFATIIAFCGHRSTSQNNPLQAGLDCGACCGHSGEPNARFAAKLLNQRFVREALKDRNIDIPDDTTFVGAVHDTTTDELHFPDTSELPLTAAHAMDHVRRAARTATHTCRLERMPSLSASSEKEVLFRARDWSETRPEWGLAGNAAFIVGPRSLTANSDLSGRVFLHSYDFRKDANFSILEQIMTAPMVVAHWINMQYYASAVDNRHFGSGSKTVHNVVGHFGVHSGNGGDLTTGLAWESLHDGESFVHDPIRLTAVIAAPRDAVKEIIRRHEAVRQLVTNGWMHLLVIAEGQTWRFTQQQNWEAMSADSECDSHKETQLSATT